jgi:predicted nucleotidyltransferase component of viral defense system
MIRTTRQLKELVRDMAKGNNTRSLIIMRNYVMERFLERLSLSDYRERLILKGGMLVSAIVGLDIRTTMDIDATIKGLGLTEESARKISEDITSIPLDDRMTFQINSVAQIMDESDYPGIRVMMTATLENMKTPLKIDYSTGDVITPKEVEYSLKLLFEERAISILAYNIETILAEKLETLFARGTANSRMRDFYDLFVLGDMQTYSPAVLKDAFVNTVDKRGSAAVIQSMDLILDEVENSPEMMALWNGYQRKFEYAEDIAWSEIMQGVHKMCDIIRTQG